MRWIHVGVSAFFCALGVAALLRNDTAVGAGLLVLALLIVVVLVWTPRRAF